MTGQAPGDFWSWSLDHYAREGVEPLLLRLQDDFGFNVNILLWTCWCAEHFDTAPELAIRKGVDLTAQWSANVTAPLRKARRHLKTPPPQIEDGDAASLREQLKTSELVAEKIEQEMLDRLARSVLASVSGGDRLARARRNLATYAALMGAAKKKGFTVSLLESLADHIFGGGAPAPAGEAP